MPPNAEEEMLPVKSWSLLKEKDHLRPPTYNAEDYAMALRRWGRRPITNDHDPQGTLPSTTSSSSGYISGSGEMTLRQFTSVSELVNKLRADLRLAFPSFVQEFSSSPADGITLLLETLRGVQLVQSTPPSAGQSGPRVGTRRAALDELGCVECLAACVERCADAPRLLSQAQPGLVALAVCLTSSLNRSRVLALQLLTKVCQIPGGHAAVSEAVSTLRLRYGEGGRFRFLAGALLAPRAAVALRVAGISFLNAFLKSAPKTQTKLYIQAEACEAGLEPRVLQEWLSEEEIIHSDKSLIDLLKKQVYKWSQNCIDVDNLQNRLARAEETCAILTSKITILQNQLKKLQNGQKMINNNDNNNYNSIINNTNSELNFNFNSSEIKQLQRLSSTGEDEGISSSECSSTPEDLHPRNHHRRHHSNHRHKQQKLLIDAGNIDNDQETTIDDVIEELRTIVKDAEEEDVRKDFNTIEVNFRDTTDETTQSTQTAGANDVTSLKIIVQGPEVEEAIVPAILYPQPPRKIPPCLSAIITGNNRRDEFLENNNNNNNNNKNQNNENNDNDRAEDEIFGDGSDSLLSASRLKYDDDCKNDEDIENGGLYLSKSGTTIRRVSELKLLKTNNHKNENKVLSISDTASNLTEPSKYSELRQCGNNKNNGNHRSQKSRVDKKLRRSVSQNYLDDEGTNLSKSAATKIEDRIRKFESMNLFDVSVKTNNNSLLCNSGTRRQINNGNLKKIRRSESCHQVSHHKSRENNDSSSNKMNNGGNSHVVLGSDSRLNYADNYYDNIILLHRSVSSNLKPHKIDVTQDFSKNKMTKKSTQITKSLDRIDEGLNSLVDIVIGGGSKNNNNGNSKSSQKQLAIKNNNRFLSSSSSSSSSSISSSSILKSDKLYGRKTNKPRYLGNEFQLNNTFGRPSSFNDNHMNNDLSIIGSFSYKKPTDKLFINDSRIFSTAGNKSHGGAFGLNQNRFNAGKYSGNPNIIGNKIESKKKIGPTNNIINRCKVTDIISGLY